MILTFLVHIVRIIGRSAQGAGRVEQQLVTLLALPRKWSPRNRFLLAISNASWLEVAVMFRKGQLGANSVKTELRPILQD
jgi:hypothetical protein